MNRPYENEAEEMVKPHGFVLDFVGIFDKLEKALAFDSDEVNAIVKDIGLLKQLFKAKMESKAPAYLALVTQNFDDKDVDNLIEHFRDKDRRKEFFKEYKEIEMLYEIISPDAFLRPFIDDYATLSSIYAVVRNAYAKTVYVDRAFQKKTNELVQKHIDTTVMEQVDRVREDRRGDDRRDQKSRGREGSQGHQSDQVDRDEQPWRTAMIRSWSPWRSAQEPCRRALRIARQHGRGAGRPAQADRARRGAKENQAAKGLDGLTYFVLCKLTDEGIGNAETVSKKVREAFAEFPNWREQREGAARTAEESHLRDLCRGGRPR